MATKSGWTVGFASKAALREMLDQPESIQADFMQIRQTIEEDGLHKLSSHHKKKIQGDIWEMRLTGEGVIARSLYLKWMGRSAIIVHVFTKKKQHIEQRHIKLALKRAKEFENAQKR
ncbi:MAG: type II toxin-antitoxin system RelE/ParE family toxin [Proteobacteria bacterium]|nr:type II toxin-antitoxin system RelE/ParE family toxin [Pseudomonadota bacterium]